MAQSMIPHVPDTNRAHLAMAGAENNRTDVNVAIDVFECGGCGSDPGDPSCRRPGASLEGQVIISTRSTLQFTCIQVLFQGRQTGRSPKHTHISLLNLCNLGRLSASITVYPWEQLQDQVNLHTSASLDGESGLTTVKAKDLVGGTA